MLGLINDAESAAACHAAGEGASRGACRSAANRTARRSQVSATVLRLTDGRFTLTGPMGAGNPADLGPTALIEVAPGIRVIVVSRKMQALDQALFRHVGIEPAECAILALKSSVHFRADFQPDRRDRDRRHRTRAGGRRPGDVEFQECPPGRAQASDEQRVILWRAANVEGGGR